MVLSGSSLGWNRVVVDDVALSLDSFLSDDDDLRRCLPLDADLLCCLFWDLSRRPLDLVLDLLDDLSRSLSFSLDDMAEILFYVRCSD